ncbi:extracellular solute-binding protein [Reinekea thalattae]|uniref:ABC transporter substrate-binding protein n=1 Tax=Reinekea thalattae TaxID=2593301 RepID=A0A5C8ZBY1_9GAMM|nr:extracellular solute-binding protein [Reinekea thalattae]TXR54681.1 ABC transporter substrate-binding protein [Reinekea thalattae]
MIRKLLICALLVPVLAHAEVTIIEAQSIALRGEPKYADDFTHFDYVNPDAPKGGTYRSEANGTWDSFNRYGQRGDPVVLSGSYYDTLMTSSADELDVYYPLIAEKIRYADDYSFITFFINPAARFSDDKAITAQDVKFTFEKLLSQGVPFIKTYYAFVKEVTIENDHQVTFHLQDADRERMIALAGLAIFPEHFWKDHDLSEPLKEVPVVSGPLLIKDFKFGQSITYVRNKNYWAKDLPSQKGRTNFDEYHYDYYRDRTIAFEAFKAGNIDIWIENISKQWATGYDIPAVKEGRMIKEEIPHSVPQGMQAFIFNTQRAPFNDPKVREAMNYALDFEWMNKNLFYGAYKRANSYFQNTAYMARELPSAEELKILEPIKNQINPRVFTEVYNPPVNDGSGNIRGSLRQALALLKQAGWEIQNKKLTNVETGELFEFELMTYSPTTERVAIPLQENLAKLGITMNIRQVDTSQFVNRWHDHDFDMVASGFSAMAYPSSALMNRWRSDLVDSTYNQANVTDDAIDYLVNGILDNLSDDEALLHWGRALDRVLLWNHYIIPQWYSSSYRVAYVNKFSRPEIRPTYDLGTDTWWIDAEKEAALTQ